MKHLILSIFIALSTYSFGQSYKNQNDSIIKVCYNLCDSISKTKILKSCSFYAQETYCNLFGNCEFYKIIDHKKITYKIKCLNGKYLCICNIKKDSILYDKISKIKSSEKTTIGDYKLKTNEYIREIPGYDNVNYYRVIYITHEPIIEVIDILKKILLN